MGDRPGHVGTGDTGGLTLASLEGTRVTDANDPTFSGTLRSTPGGGWVIDAGGSPRRQRRLTTGMGVVSSAGRLLVLGSGFAVAEDRQLSPSQLEDFFNPGGGTGTAGRAPPAFASTSAGLQQAFQNEQTLLSQGHDNALAILNAQLASAEGINRANIEAQINLENLRHENDLKELALQFENQLKTSVIGEIGAERRTLIQEQGATKRQLLELGPDPFKQSAALSGGAVRGTTPQQVAVGRAQQFIDQDLPVLDFNATLSQLQSQLGTLQGLEAPQLTGGFGLPSLAHGGVVTDSGVAPLEMQRGSDGVFSLTPAIVGEAGPELALLPPGAEIIPLSKLPGMDLTGIPRAQEGLKLSGLQALAPLFQGLGLSGIPVTRRGPEGEIFGTGFPGIETFNKLGVRPRLVRDTLTSNVFLIENGVHRFISPEAWIASGFQRADIVNLSHEDVLKLAPTRGADLPTNFPVSVPTSEPPAFQASGVPLIEPSTGAALPEAFKIARQLGQFSRERPDLFSNALSAFRAAGRDPSTVIAQINAATPTGRFERPQRIGFTGSRI